MTDSLTKRDQPDRSKINMKQDMRCITGPST